MGKQLENEVDYYYDLYPTKEDLMGESVLHAYLVRYLVLLLEYLFQGQVFGVYNNLNFFQTDDPDEYPLAPDVAVVKGLPLQVVTSWRLGKTGPAPQVVFEIASKKTWKKDREDKVRRYAEIGVEEYFLYDPTDPPLWRDIPHRLLGWRRDKARQQMYTIPHDERGRLWSVQLDSWLVPDGDYLRLYDRKNQLRLTKAQALAEKLRSLGINPDEIV